MGSLFQKNNKSPFECCILLPLESFHVLINIFLIRSLSLNFMQTTIFLPKLTYTVNHFVRF